MMIDNKKREYIYKILKEFICVERIKEIKELKGGHINSTYLITLPEAKYILQQINHHVFSSPYGMMHNIDEVTEHMRRRLIFDGYDPNRHTLSTIKTIYGQLLCIRDDTYWRCMSYIDNSTAYEHVTSPELMYEIGCAVGDFQAMLDGFHTRVLDDTIRHFHDTPYRYKKFLDVITLDKCERVQECKDEIAYIKKRNKKFGTIVQAVEEKVIPRRVTHNDTKSSNILIDDVTHKALCMIDLDTVMRGSLLYDYGHALRNGCSNALEDDRDLNNVTINFELFESFNRGFLKSVKEIITVAEVKLLYVGFFLMTIEVAMRFLTDYLDGDRYFKIDYKDHNLVRACNQIKMTKEIEANEELIKNIIRNILKELDYPEEFTI